MFKKIAALSCGVLIGLVIAFARAGAFPFWNSDSHSQQAKSHPPASSVQTAQAESGGRPAPANQPEPNENGAPIPSFAPLVKRVMPSVVNEFCAPELNVSGTPSTAMVAEKGPAPLPSTRRSNFCPVRNRAPLGGETLTSVGSA